MPTIGSRELRANLGRVLRDVRRRRMSYTITHRGRIIARLEPVAPETAHGLDFEALWSEMDALAAEIGRDWPPDLSAADAITEDRGRRPIDGR
jgi:prevent-host-death family protein